MFKYTESSILHDASYALLTKVVCNYLNNVSLYVSIKHV